MERSVCKGHPGCSVEGPDGSPRATLAPQSLDEASLRFLPSYHPNLVQPTSQPQGTLQHVFKGEDGADIFSRPLAPSLTSGEWNIPWKSFRSLF